MLNSLLLISLLLSPNGTFLRQIDGFLEPAHAIWLPDGTIAVADRMADEIVIITPEGVRISAVSVENPMELQFDESGEVTAGAVARPSWDTEDVVHAG
ncbi:MAG: hypothetical protein P8N28_03465, partial [Phycisphaerales bacterium]|nr:hypothetical protein [Phycisphaerales bacterium]